MALLVALGAGAVATPANRPGRAMDQGLRAGNQSARKPNVVIILGDDLGYCDTGLYGCKDIPTPNINAIARRGALFTNGYSAAPVCSPSRAGLITGRYQQRFGFEFNAGPLQRAIGDPEMGLPVSEITLAQVMKQAGYATGMVGKWHLGMRDKFHPTERGFDEYFGFLFGANIYVNPARADVKNAAAGGAEATPAWPRVARNPIYRGKTPVEEEEYLTDAFAREAVAFIERHKAEPFFLYAPFNAPHTPLQAPKEYLDRYADIADTKRRTYAAMVSCVDDQVGRIVAALEKRGMTKETLIAFSSDNGGPLGSGATNGRWRAGKGTLYEGGVRVCAFANWPGKIAAGTIVKEPLHIVDWYPTVLKLAGVSLEQKLPLDGRDAWPTIAAGKPTPHPELLLNTTPANGAIRAGDWKLVVGGNRSEVDGTPTTTKGKGKKGGASDSVELFNLADDPYEKTNLADRQPEKVKELSARLEAYAQAAVPPKSAPQSANFQVPKVWGE